MIHHSSLPVLTFNTLIFILSRSITLSQLAQLKKLERTVEQLLEAFFLAIRRLDQDQPPATQTTDEAKTRRVAPS